jgi:hypothetical protein
METMMGRYILNEKNEIIPCEDLLEWAKWMSLDKRKVALDIVGDIKISTIFLGLDHNWGDGPPILFETMIFGGEHDQFQERYNTREEALIRHAEAVKLVKGE